MNGLKLEHVLLEPLEQRLVTTEPAMNHAQLWAHALSLAAGLQARGIKRVAVHLEDAGLLAIALLGAWRAGVSVLLPADLQPQTRQRWDTAVDAWLIDAGDLDA
ncbi:MAG: AMP-binding protein, partial [Pseudomonas sp.]